MPNITSKPWVKQITDSGVLMFVAGALFMLALIVTSAFLLRLLLA
ncbi:MAG: hypothetical protein AB7L90_25890 [Hyphomicrobiaceae bacterium]